MPMQVQIDPTLPVRGVDFKNLILLLYALTNLMPIRYTDALEVVTQHRVINSARGEKGALKKSSFYHHWYALRVLGLIEQIDHKLYLVTPFGKTLVEYGIENNELTHGAKQVFREGMLKSQEIWHNFLILFTCQSTPTLTPLIGNYVAFKPAHPKEFGLSNVRRFTTIYSSCLDYSITSSDPRIHQMIIYGLRQWGLQCGLIDEIYPTITSKSFKGITSFMYLLDIDKDANLSVDNFSDILRNYISSAETILGSTLRFDLSELLPQMCSQEGISLSKVQDILVAWVARNQLDAVLERPSVGLIEEQASKRNKLKLMTNQPWVNKDGSVYTALLVRKRLFA